MTNVYADPKLGTIGSEHFLNNSQKQKLKNLLGNRIRKELTPLKNDYNNDFDRVTVEYHTGMRTDKLGRTFPVVMNYAYHKVIIPDGTTVENRTFLAKNPDSEIVFGKNLTFINCRLTNVKLDPTWILIDTPNHQIKRDVISIVDNGETSTVTVVNRIKKGNDYVDQSTEVNEVLNGDLDQYLLTYTSIPE